MYSKTQIYSKNNLHDFLFLWKLKVYWTMSCQKVWTMFKYFDVTNFWKFPFQNMSFSNKDVCKCVINWNFEKNHIHMEDDKHF
jgi:hypothetical protein